MAEDDIVTIRDIYTLVQQLNTQVAGLSQQVSTLTERAAEDRDAAEALGEEMGKLKIKVYAAIVALTLASSLIMTFTQLGSAQQ